MQEAHAGATFGAFGGEGWEWINLAMLAGGIWLLAMEIIRWHIPVAMLARCSRTAADHAGGGSRRYAGPLFH